MSDMKTYPFQKSDEEWRRILTPEQYAVLRGHATERPGSCALLDEHREGTFACAGCQQPLFVAGRKFESGTGWRHRVNGRPQLWHDPHRGPLQPVWRPPGPRVRRRPAADRTAVLHQRSGAEFRSCTLMRAGASRSGGRVDFRVTLSTVGTVCHPQATRGTSTSTYRPFRAIARHMSWRSQ